MRKGIKILGKVLSTIALLLIFLPIATTLVLNVEPVQNAVVRRAANYASAHLGTDVYIDGIDFDLFSKVRIRGLYVEDYNNDTLLYVTHASTSIDNLNISKDGLKLSNAKMYGAKLHLRELPSGELNIHPILNQLRNSDGESNFKLYADDIEAENISLLYEKLEHKEPHYGVDMGNIQLRNIDTHLTNFAVVKGAVWTDIEHLTAEERSGFELHELTSHLYINSGEIIFDGLDITTEQSSLYLPKLELRGQSWSEYKDFSHNVEIVGRTEHSRLSTNDMAYLIPAVKDWDININTLSATLGGTLQEFEGEIKSAKLGNSTDLAATYRIRGLSDWQTARYVIGIESLYSTSDDLLTIANNIAPKELPKQAKDIIERLEWIDMRTTIGGVLSDFRVVGNILSGAGELSGDVIVKKSEHERLDVIGELKSVDLNIEDILSINNLRAVTSEVAFNGSVGAARTGGIIGDVALKVASINYMGYRLSDIEGEGSIAGESYIADIKSNDPNLKFDLRADIYLDATNPTYITSLALKRANLTALGINRRDSISVASANIGVNLEGDFQNGIDGNVSIADVEYIYPNGTIATDRIKVEFENREVNKSIHLISDFLTLDYQSDATYIEAYRHIYNALEHYLPLLYENSSDNTTEYKSGSAKGDNTALTLRAGESINDLLDAIAEGVIIAPNTTFDLRYNPSVNSISIRGESDAVEYAGVIMADLECNVNNNKDRNSLVLALDTEGIYAGTRALMPNFNIHGDINNNTVDIAVAFNEESNNGNSAMLALKAELQRDTQTMRRKVHVDLIPSYFNNSTLHWDLYANGIDITPSNISINNLHIARPDQQLIIDGNISNSLQDSVRLTLENFDISGLSVLLERTGYDIDGVSNGYAVVKSALQNPEVNASIALDSLKINGISVAPQFITSNWDMVGDRAHIIITDRGLNETVVEGYYQPISNRYSAKAKIRNASMSLLKPYLKSVLSDIEGVADIDARIEGEGNKAILSGDLSAKDFGATVNYTKVRYKAPTAKFTIDSNHIRTVRTPLYDVDGNIGHLTLDVDLSNLDNVTYDVSAEITKMLALNTTPQDNDTFYGHVYATGEATFKGDKRGTKMNIDITSADNSKFYLPLQRKEDVSYASFVRFVEPDVETIDTIDFLTRRMLASERRRRDENPTSKTLDIDMNLNVLPNIEMQLIIDPTMGDVIKGKGSGELAMHIVPESDLFEMRGDLNITEGSYLFTLLNVTNKFFTVVPGSSIHWDGDPKAATLNIDAIYSTKASLRALIGSSVQGFDTSHTVPVDCYIKLTDELNSPTVTFDIKVPNVAPEIQTIVQSALNDQHAIATQMFWLLTSNAFAANDAEITGASITTTTGWELLSNQLSNWLSGEDYNIILRYRPRTDLAGDEVDFGFSKSWFNNRLLVELEGGYLSDASAQAMQKASKFVGEAFITWLIDPEGVFRFRGFTQTIDRYGENQGMQESGIGLYYSESFNTLSELKQSFKNRFGGKNTLISPFLNVTKSRKEDSPSVTTNNNKKQESLDIIEADTLQTDRTNIIINN